MAVEVLAGAVVAHGGARIGMAGGDLDIAQVDSSVKHRSDEGVSQHVGVHSGDVDAAFFSEMAESASRAVSVHPGTATCEQDWAALAIVDGAVDGSPDCWWERRQGNPSALASHLQDPVAVFLTEVFDVRPARLKDPQTEKPQHRDQGEVVGVAG